MILTRDGKEPTPVLLGAIIKDHRKRKGLTQAELADLLKINRNTIINWESDKCRPDYEDLNELCRFLGIRMYEIFPSQFDTAVSTFENRLLRILRTLSEDSQRVVASMVSAMAEQEQNSHGNFLRENYKLIFVRPGSVAAGQGDEVPDLRPDYAYVRKNSVNAKADGIVLVNGHSMEPDYCDGEYVYYEDATAASPGDDVIVDTDRGAVIKRLNDQYQLYSVNPNLPYEKKYESNSFAIRGKVLGTVADTDQPPARDLSELDSYFSKEVLQFKKKYHLIDDDD